MFSRPPLLLFILSLSTLGCDSPSASQNNVPALAVTAGAPDTHAGQRGLSSEALPAEFPAFVDVPREPRQVLKPDAAQVLRSNNQFACDLYAWLRTEQAGNLFFSPSNISTVFAMTYAGAQGQTAKEIARVLHFDLPHSRLSPAFGEFLASIRINQPGCEAFGANQLWSQKGNSVLPEYRETTRMHYGAELAELDFGEPEAARQTINHWVGQQTKGKIGELIGSGGIDAMTRLVLTSCIYFKGDWVSKFDKDATRQAPFRTNAAKQVEIPLMFQKGTFRWGAADGVQMLELPYVGESLSMLILLPDTVDGLAGLEQKLTAKNLELWNSKLSPTEVEVYFPMLSMKHETRLGDVLQAMGMNAAFDPNEADFSGINGARDLYISAVVHQATLDVDEQGTEAAAATAVMAMTGAPPKQIVFRADRPFVLLIQDRSTGAVLFLGRIVEPTGA